MQGTEDELDNSEKFQQDALGSVRLKVSASPVSVNYACPHHQTYYQNKHAVRMHEVIKFQLMHVFHAYMPATNWLCCMWEYNTKEKLLDIQNIFKHCLSHVCLPHTDEVMAERSQAEQN